MGYLLTDETYYDLIKREIRMIADENVYSAMKNASVVPCHPLAYPISNHNRFNKNSIKDVIYNNPATIVKWKDGTKTVVKCQEGDKYNPELGLAMCIIKKCCNNKGNYNDIFEKWLPKKENNNEESI